ncbi:hypothetical protein CSC2_39360 [Clostridium zeae]|uniref:Glycosyltransferase RgtA/B/C/D-like domain-containing protein n=1 Tax=Clostridium zeae TaxID=2759022 RepID=A0ABQ1EF52_9CLOT|nr:glycosyltransferase family 39 protein [Clostridium zeae]GFZ33410.1 hypothetical protein CSC2_39360 [Clostridium zeae]
MTVFFKKGLYLILTFFIGIFIISSFFIRAKYSFSVYGDNPILERQNIGVFILVITVLVLLNIALYKLCLKLNRYSKKIVIPVTLLLSFLVQLGIIFAFTVLPTADSQTVVSLALNMLYNNDYSSFQAGGYLYMFPFNYSIVLYLKALLAIFPDNYLVIKIFNILFTLVTTLMIYLIYKQINYKSKENDYGILVFGATYIPALLMSNFIYNDIIGTALLTSAIYFIIRFVKEKNIKHIIISSVLLSMGNYFRGIGVLYLIAAIIYILLSLKKIGLKKVATALLIVISLFNIPNWTQNIALQLANKVSESITINSTPVYMWLNMGINMDRFGFWDNFQSYNIYQQQAGYNKEESIQLYKQSIEDKLSNATFGDLITMYYKKIVWTWTEGTYQIDRYGIGDDGTTNKSQRMSMISGYSYTTFATDLFKGDSLYRSSLLLVLYVMNFLMYCFILIRLINSMKIKRYDEVLLVLVILGFIAFYILWEIKSRYIYPVYPLLIALSYMGFKDTYDFLLEKNARVFLVL